MKETKKQKQLINIHNPGNPRSPLAAKHTGQGSRRRSRAVGENVVMVKSACDFTHTHTHTHSLSLSLSLSLSRLLLLRLLRLLRLLLSSFLPSFLSSFLSFFPSFLPFFIPFIHPFFPPIFPTPPKAKSNRCLQPNPRALVRATWKPSPRTATIATARRG